MPGSGTDKPLPLVLLPGLLCDERLWQQQARALGPEREVQIADLSLDASIAEMARRTLQQAPAQFALAALSMGGYVAMEMLRQAPERVLKLALFDTMARPDDEARARMRRGLLALARQGRFKGVTPHLLPRLMHPRCLDTPVAKLVQDMALAIGKEGFVRQQQAIIDRADYRPLLASIKVPTLIVVGENDAITPLAEAQFLHQGIVGSRLQVLAQCGHLPPLEHPQRTTELLRDWLTPTAGL
ncbi:pimeloyl-ACP methyl ester carboxylesterase [Pseudomonas protegens]|uniref:alpha/beta fold hydrolase n=1 Tax=Pseudomonas TaxID=286 RepID=UPI000806F63B|nr:MULTISPECIES: alpha/beta fold hydrolase [Pseudomonas]OBZ22209.1 alpha/beta hydrolase [Pseudomonas protegens]OBZ28620.1 alpha/beta hydrolase [Pseudomonas protegens]OKK37702.1 alpha/beta hydrolase [Pseudomonas protegens]OKK45658.1 alpha/beta hydrolase [Pseudomonas protegens]OKK54156.1 alpha/beta hydrolase [Pseudomonas protegens]